jgi:hypothetical protein
MSLSFNGTAVASSQPWAPSVFSITAIPSDAIASCQQHPDCLPTADRPQTVSKEVAQGIGRDMLSISVLALGTGVGIVGLILIVLIVIVVLRIL